MNKRTYIPLIILLGLIAIILSIPAKGWKVYKVKDGLADNVIRSLTTAPDGSLWVGNGTGISHYDPDTRQWTSYPVGDGLPGNWVDAITVSAEGVVWIGVASKLMSYDPRIGHWVEYPIFENQKSLYTGIEAIAIAPDDSVWVGTYGSGVFHFNPETGILLQYTTENGLLHDEINAVVVSPDGIVWMATDGGLSSFDPAKQDWSRFTRDALPSIYVYSLAVGSDGSIWIGTMMGLARFEEAAQKRMVYTMEDGLPDCQIRSIAEAPDGTIWVGTWSGGIAQLDLQTNTWRAYGNRNGRPCSLRNQLPGPDCKSVESIAVSSDGAVWSRLLWVDKLFRFDPDLHEN